MISQIVSLQMCEGMVITCKLYYIEGAQSRYRDLWVIPCQINAKNGRPPQISTKLGLQVEPHDLLAQTKFLPPKLCGFYFTALQKLDFSCIFALTDHMKQTVFSFLLHLRRHFLYKSVAYEQFSHMV